MDEPAEVKRLRIRSWRRGIKEMDLILGGWSDDCLAALSPDELAHYEALLSENDHDLYAWVSGKEPAPDRFATLIARIADHARHSAAARRTGQV